MAEAERLSDVPDDRRVLGGIERLVVDGTNVLHALHRSPQPLPAAALVGRLRAIVPPNVTVVVVLDGSPEHGLVTRHVASGVEVRYAGREPADALIARLVAAPDFGGDPAARAATLVVTDDAELTAAVRRAGARTARNAWLLGRLARQRIVAPAPATPRRLPPQVPDEPDDEATSGWAPGRGATRKRGNPRRLPRSRRPSG